MSINIAGSKNNLLQAEGDGVESVTAKDFQFIFDPEQTFTANVLPFTVRHLYHEQGELSSTEF